jgi:hypothetical protein
MLLDLSETEVKELESLAKKSNALVKLLDFYNKIEEDAIMNTFITNTIKLIEINDKVRSAKFDINDKEDKGFERIMKAMIESSEIASKLEEIKKTFSEEEVKEVAKRMRGGRESNWFSRVNSK